MLARVLRLISISKARNVTACLFVKGMHVIPTLVAFEVEEDPALHVEIKSEIVGNT